MKKILDLLLKYQDLKYKDFVSKLAPTVNKDFFIGIRVPELRKIAKEIIEKDAYKFLEELPHKYYEENLLHGFIIQRIKNYDECIKRLNIFLPYVDNWAVSDTMMPKIFSKNKNKLLKEIKKWIKSKHTYTIRFGVDCLMALYLDNDFKVEYLDLVKKIKSNEYYVNMMISWYFATALAKQYDSTISIFESKELDKWVHNKSIQKAIESYRVTDEHKGYLRELKIK